MRYYGFCIYPHGGTTLAGLLISTSAAFIATCYGTLSCRFLNVAFSSDRGGFEEHFLNGQAAEGRTEPVTFRAGVGLYQWLRPVNVLEDWADGQCAGYSEIMLEQLSDAMFETARVFGVLAVLMSFVVFLWTLGTACFGLNRLQIALFTFCTIMGTASASLTFLVIRSSMCETLFLSRECTIDEGGLVMIIGTILWLIAAVISLVYMRESDLGDLSKYASTDIEDDDENHLSPEQQGKLAGELARQKVLADREAQRASHAARTGKTHPNDGRNWKKPISTVGDENSPNVNKGSNVLTPATAASTPPPRRPVRSSRRDAPMDLPRPEARSRLQEKLYEPRARSVVKSRSTIIVDDVSNHDAMEVYFTPPRKRQPLSGDLHEV